MYTRSIKNCAWLFAFYLLANHASIATSDPFEHEQDKSKVIEPKLPVELVDRILIELVPHSVGARIHHLNKFYFEKVTGMPFEYIAHMGLSQLKAIFEKGDLKRGHTFRMSKGIIVDYKASSNPSLSSYLWLSFVTHVINPPQANFNLIAQYTSVSQLTLNNDYDFKSNRSLFELLKKSPITRLNTQWTPHLQRFIHSLQEPLKLKHLEIRHRENYHANDIDTLCTLAQHTPNLRTFKLYTYKRLIYEGFQRLPKLLALWPHLKHLDMVGVSIGENFNNNPKQTRLFRENFLQALLSLKNLHTLKMRYFPGSIFDPIDFCKLAGRLPYLKTLQFDTCGIDGDKVLKITEKLKYKKSIQKLVLVNGDADRVLNTYATRESFVDNLMKSKIRTVNFVEYKKISHHKDGNQPTTSIRTESLHPELNIQIIKMWNTSTKSNLLYY